MGKKMRERSNNEKMGKKLLVDHQNMIRLAHASRATNAIHVSFGGHQGAGSMCGGSSANSI